MHRSARAATTEGARRLLWAMVAASALVGCACTNAGVRARQIDRCRVLSSQLVADLRGFAGRWQSEAGSVSDAGRRDAAARVARAASRLADDVEAHVPAQPYLRSLNAFLDSARAVDGDLKAFRDASQLGLEIYGVCHSTTDEYAARERREASEKEGKGDPDDPRNLAALSPAWTHARGDGDPQGTVKWIGFHPRDKQIYLYADDFERGGVLALDADGKQAFSLRRRVARPSLHPHAGLVLGWSTPTAKGDLVYSVGRVGADGKAIWTVDVMKATVGYVRALDGGAVVAIEQDSTDRSAPCRLSVREPKEGKLVASAPVGTSGGACALDTSGDTIYAEATKDHVLYAFDASGKELYRIALGSGDYRTTRRFAGARGDFVYLVSRDGVHGYRGGKEAFTLAVQDAREYGGFVDGAGNLHVAANGSIIRVSPAGKLEWRVPTCGADDQERAIRESGRACLKGTPEFVADDGERTWWFYYAFLYAVDGRGQIVFDRTEPNVHDLRGTFDDQGRLVLSSPLHKDVRAYARSVVEAALVRRK